MRSGAEVSGSSLIPGSLVKLVTLWPLCPGLSLGVLLRVGRTRALGARGGVGSLDERVGIGADRITWIGTMVVGVRPFSRIGFAHGRIQSMVRIAVTRPIFRVLARGLGNAGGWLALRFVWHGPNFPSRSSELTPG